MSKKSKKKTESRWGGSRNRGPRRGRKLPATITQEHDWESDGSASRVSRLFAVILIVHLAAVALLVAHALTRDNSPPPSPLDRVKSDENSTAMAGVEVQKPAVVERPSTGNAYLATYRVVSGDSLQMIATKLRVSEEALMRINGLHTGTSLYPGQKLYVPSATPAGAERQVAGVLGGADAAAPVTPAPPAESPLLRPREEPPTPRASVVSQTPSPAVAPVRPAAPPTALGVREYRFSEGDTLYGLSRKFGVSLDQILGVNNIPDPTKIRVGTIIKVPVTQR